MKTQEAASRIIVALYGKDVVYRAPETFEPGHRALVYLAGGYQTGLKDIVTEVEAARQAFDAGHGGEGVRSDDER